MQAHFDGKGPQIAANMDSYGQQVTAACLAACTDAAKEIERRGRADIAGGGNFGPRWQQGFNSRVVEKKDAFDIVTTMGGGPPVSYWKIFEYGATISAKNPSGLMWIPFDKGNTTWPRDYGGSLFRIGRALFDSDTKKPMYFGTPSVRIPQKFHLRDIIRQVSKELSQFYATHMRK
jgi:hypothetical protein